MALLPSGCSAASSLARAPRHTTRYQPILPRLPLVQLLHIEDTTTALHHCRANTTTMKSRWDGRTTLLRPRAPGLTTCRPSSRHWCTSTLQSCRSRRQPCRTSGSQYIPW